MSTDSDVKRAYSLKEAAVYLGISESHLRKLKTDSVIPAKRMGKPLIFLREDMDRFLDGLEEAS